MKRALVALVTAASQGIGEAIARELAGCGYRLGLLARSAAVISLGEELGAVAVQGDIREAASTERLVAAARDRYGRIDAVVNNTGHPPKGDLLELSDADWGAGHELILAGAVTARFCSFSEPLAGARGSEPSYDRKGVISRKTHTFMRLVRFAWPGW